jgi:hypothetical protein
MTEDGKEAEESLNLQQGHCLTKEKVNFKLRMRADVTDLIGEQQRDNKSHFEQILAFLRLRGRTDVQSTLRTSVSKDWTTRESQIKDRYSCNY